MGSFEKPGRRKEDFHVPPDDPSKIRAALESVKKIFRGSPPEEVVEGFLKKGEPKAAQIFAEKSKDLQKKRDLNNPQQELDLTIKIDPKDPKLDSGR